MVSAATLRINFHVKIWGKNKFRWKLIFRFLVFQSFHHFLCFILSIVTFLHHQTILSMEINKNTFNAHKYQTAFKANAIDFPAYLKAAADGEWGVSYPIKALWSSRNSFANLLSSTRKILSSGILVVLSVSLVRVGCSGEKVSIAATSRTKFLSFNFSPAADFFFPCANYKGQKRLWNNIIWDQIKGEERESYKA